MLDTVRFPLDADVAQRSSGYADSAADRKFVVALARGLEVLRAFKADDGFLGNQEIASRTKLPKPTVSRLTYTLTKLGYLTHLPQVGKYQLAPGARALWYAALAHMGIRHVARPIMQELADYATCAVALGSRDRLSVIYLEHCHSSSPLALRLSVGSRIPIATTAIGRALLAAMPVEEREDIFDRLAKREGAAWPRIKAGIDQALDDVATRGFSISAGDWYADVNAVGAALVLADGSGTFAFNCGAPAFRVDRQRLLDDIGPRLVASVEKIEGVLNGSDGGWRKSMKQQRHQEGGRRGGGPSAASWTDGGGGEQG